MFPSNTNFDTKVTLESAARRADDDDPFRLLLLGDWSGKTVQSPANSSEFLPIEIDRDNFDEVIKKFGLELQLDFAGDDNKLVNLQIQEYEDFHPDKIYQQLPHFTHLRELRLKLLKPDTFESAAREVRTWFDISDSKQEKLNESEPNAPVQGVDLLDQILSQSSDEVPIKTPQVTDKNELSDFVAQLVKPFLIHTDENEQKDLVSVVDRAASEIMREILHHPKFQAIESAWAGLYFLVRRTETGTDLKIFICDVSKDELSQHLKRSDNLTDSSFFQTIFPDEFGSDYGNWAVIGGNYKFDLEIDDAALLIRLAQISKIAEAPFIASITQDFFENNLLQSVAQNKLWQTIRSLPESSYLGLAFPDFLARLPFGEKTDPIDSFSFEEFDKSSEINHTWINPVFASLYLLAYNFQINGWEFGNQFQKQIDVLPIHIYQTDDSTVKKVLQTVLNQNSCLNLLESGIMPLITFQDSDSVTLARFQSVSEPFSLLSAKWDGA